MKRENDELESALTSGTEIPAGVDRRSFLMRSAVISAAALMTGRTLTPEARAAATAAPPSRPQVPLSRT